MPGNRAHGMRRLRKSDPPTCPDPVTRPGDIWILGDHRLMCGDSTDAAAVARLMDGQRSYAPLHLAALWPAARLRRGEGAGQRWDRLMQGRVRRSAGERGRAAAGQSRAGASRRRMDPLLGRWIQWMRAQGWRRFGWYVWDQGPGLPGDWNGRLCARLHEFIFHFNRTPTPAEQDGRDKACRRELGGGGLRAADGTVSAQARRRATPSRATASPTA